MENYLNRELHSWEHVHHKDGDKLNNSIENLELLDASAHTAKHHSGSKRTDQTKITMAVIRTMRIDIQRLTKINSEMLELLEFLTNMHSDGELHTKIVNMVKKARGEL